MLTDLFCCPRLGPRLLDETYVLDKPASGIDEAFLESESGEGSCVEFICIFDIYKSLFCR